MENKDIISGLIFEILNLWFNENLYLEVFAERPGQYTVNFNIKLNKINLYILNAICKLFEFFSGFWTISACFCISIISGLAVECLNEEMYHWR